MCDFTCEVMPPCDREIANYFTATHPKSHFRNRLVVMLDWAWAYWTYQRHARIVTGTDERTNTPSLPRGP